MLSITNPIVNDRISNRIDTVVGTGADLVKRLGRCFQQLRCLMHQQCLQVALERGFNPRGRGRGFKRFSFEPATMPAIAPITGRYWLAESSYFGRASAGHRAVHYAG